MSRPNTLLDGVHDSPSSALESEGIYRTALMKWYNPAPIPKKAPSSKNQGSVFQWESAQRPPNTPSTTDKANVQPKCVYRATVRIVAAHEVLSGDGGVLVDIFSPSPYRHTISPCHHGYIASDTNSQESVCTYRMRMDINLNAAYAMREGDGQ